jgi:hypothetical protein
VQKWILASEMVIHFDCTTGIEAIIAGTPSISYKTTIYDENKTAWLPVAVSHQANNLKELDDAIKYYLNGNEFRLSVDNEKLLQGYFYNLKGKTSDSILDVLDSMSFDSRKNYNMYNLIESVKNLKRRKLSSFFKRDELEEKVRILSNILKINVSMKYIGNEIVLLQKK